jgi:FlaA1/EpsC-like NDP-sugar epimerase
VGFQNQREVPSPSSLHADPPEHPLVGRQLPLPLFSLIQKQVVLRRLILMGIDGGLIAICFVAALVLRLQQQQGLAMVVVDHLAMVPWAVGSGLLVLYLSGWYRGLTRSSGSHSFYGFLPRATLMVLVMLPICSLLGGYQPPRTFWILYWLLISGTAIASRIVLRDLLILQLNRDQRRSLPSGPPVLRTMIYGAGSTGMRLLQELRNDSRFRVIGFLDDERSLQGRRLQNLPIHLPHELPALIARHRVEQVLLALPSVPRHRKRMLVDLLTNEGLKVLSIPSLAQLATGQRVVTDLQAVAIEDLLGREPSTPDPELLAVAVAGKGVLVTGGGGSIGSELCRQVLTIGARCLVVYERSEFALFTIHLELSKQCPADVDLVPVLGDATDATHLTRLCRRYGIETIFHAAAYKHVPMVEANLCAGVANNLHATQAVIESAWAANVERLTLISTDKAVRPTNVMGASKRVCELLIQSAARERSRREAGPVFSMVRFGNVLASSGSVIPLFHQQIAEGGPVTVTHPSVTRYFMTIPEAVQLVLQATGLARGGDLFLLDMGEPVRIADLARQMIELSGLRVRDERHPDGDIEVTYTGLRPGEKLYEELLIRPGDEPTLHPLIRRAQEPMSGHEEFGWKLSQLEQALAAWDESATLESLHRLVEGYKAEVTTASHP